MSRKMQTLVLFVLLLFLGLHFFLISVFAYPFTKSVNAKKYYYAQWYVYPYFNQSWNLFVPTPNTNYKLFVSYESRGIHQLDLLNEILMRHQKNRFSGHSAIVLTFVNSIHYFEKNSALQGVLNGPIKDDLNFTILENSVKNYIESDLNSKITNLKLMLYVEILNSDIRRVYYN